MIENDWIDHDFIEKNTVGFEGVAEHVKQWTARLTAEVTGIAEKSIRAAAELWERRKPASSCTRAIRITIEGTSITATLADNATSQTSRRCFRSRSR